MIDNREMMLDKNLKFLITFLVNHYNYYFAADCHEHEYYTFRFPAIKKVFEIYYYIKGLFC